MKTLCGRCIVASFVCFCCQAFPAKHGWPFPQYFGACGRMIFVENGGTELTDYLGRPWVERLLVAMAFMDTIIKLTDNDEMWRLHMLDLSFGNFAVRGSMSGRGYSVTVIDAEHIILVHKSDPSKWTTLGD